ncbi:MAG: zinc-ribbon domain-containing protein, partial [Myxococcales bacterium]|nr:zinc-ribbon domain-containing protein [Myxococcales bacterium]
MIKVECPSCQASYDLDERRVPDKGMRMRCPKCSSSFVVDKQGETALAAPSKAPPAKPPGAPRTGTVMGMVAAPPRPAPAPPPPARPAPAPPP